ncbi:hypothetical protein PLEOSDRAFT_1106608 [Pleurotus ostreatus PC15]|uniref:Origin recognition complex subunit 6 n=1 Tax=Pleurotus ostreatus (strain PC15) TaxID=1137138 RepID=A0A067NCX0_PLEO1|nr:hypothetical protein PLEOSDRAFT_1106608 [Pleurotus ostreatus PC15]
MSAPEQRLLRQMCSRAETSAQAAALIQRARLQTTPGSGHTLGSLSSGLPAICAYIASTRLNNGDVTKQDAQLASCLQPSDFEKALGIIESAIGAPRPLKNTRNSTGITYESLFRVYSISESPTMLRIMHKVEQIVIKYAPDTSRRVIICTIFFWTCKVLKISSFTIQSAEFLEKNEIDYDSYAYIINILKTRCRDLKADLEDEWAAMQRLQASSSGSPAKPTQVSLSPTKSPSKKKALRELPSRDTKKHEVALFPAAETVAPSTPTSPAKRRKLDPPVRSETAAEPSASDVPVDPPTPSTRSITIRRQPAIAPPPATTSQDVATISTPRRQRSSVSVSPSKKSRGKEPEVDVVDTSAMDVDEDAESSSPSDDGDVLVSRRFRPVFLDHKQWYRRDPRMARIWRTAEAHKEAMTKLYGHPFEEYRPQAVLSP